jgi:acyl-CoA reductase-like NAD-dependent aldehyde dehydrogenase
MMDEVFGPILPFLTVDSPEEAIRFINARYTILSSPRYRSSVIWDFS